MHYKNVCKHGKVQSQCRCPDPNKTVRTVPCSCPEPDPVPLLERIDALLSAATPKGAWKT